MVLAILDKRKMREAVSRRGGKLGARNGAEDIPLGP